MKRAADKAEKAAKDAADASDELKKGLRMKNCFRNRTLSIN
jgi:hypothetical protein